MPLLKAKFDFVDIDLIELAMDIGYFHITLIKSID